MLHQRVEGRCGKEDGEASTCGVWLFSKPSLNCGS